MSDPSSPLSTAIPSLLPRGDGHQFLLYGDACSGVPGALHERTFAAINGVASRLTPAPEFVIFPGDEIIGLTTDEAALRSQWRHWLDVEMAWLNRDTVPLYHTTGNHTTYDVRSERIFAEMLTYLPRNGPTDQQGLSYFVRRGDLLIVFVNTMWSGLGGEGHVETAWLVDTLRQHADARHKLVVGHHPVFPVNGYSGENQREIGAAYAVPFWQILVEHQVFAYICSHILAFDVQVHDGVLQILTAGAGTAHRMPEEHEYLHCVQAALDNQGLRYQVLDENSRIREQLSWPPVLSSSAGWIRLPIGESTAPIQREVGDTALDRSIIALHCCGHTAGAEEARPQTFFATWSEDAALPVFWLGLTGPSQRITAIVGHSRVAAHITGMVRTWVAIRILTFNSRYMPIWGRAGFCGAWMRLRHGHRYVLHQRGAPRNSSGRRAGRWVIVKVGRRIHRLWGETLPSRGTLARYSARPRRGARVRRLGKAGEPSKAMDTCSMTLLILTSCPYC